MLCTVLGESELGIDTNLKSKRSTKRVELCSQDRGIGISVKNN
jgi:hypothetical protein